MRIATWRTGHDIADTVTNALKESLNGADFNTQQISEERIGAYDCHMAYGILRGTADVFNAANRRRKPYFNVDRGYFRPGHYDGYYRISLNGTQQTKVFPAADYGRLEALEVKIKPWRGFAPKLPVLICPPSHYVAHFFGVPDWLRNTTEHLHAPYEVRTKGMGSALRLENYNYVLTFNSSVGWQALQAGVPCISDTTHSMVGNFFHKIPLDQLSDAQYVKRNELFARMAALQMSLQEMRNGKLWPLISNLLSSLALIPENPIVPMSAHIPLSGAPLQNLISAF